MGNKNNMTMTRLSVNVNKIATLRNARGGNLPDLLQMVKDIERFGAQGITVHPRPDERHIRRQDVYDIKRIITTELNIEGYPDERLLNIIADVRHDQVTLVPDAPGVITSNAGWNTRDNLSLLTDIIGQIKQSAGRVSVFVNADPSMMPYARRAGADRIDLYTGPYAERYASDPAEAVRPFVDAATAAHEVGLGINAGHDLNLTNLAYIRQQIAWLDEVSIGHALICDALYLGLENTISQYLRRLQ